MAFQLISDSSCDLDPQVAAERNIRVVPFYVSFSENEYLREGEDISVRDFYQKMVDQPNSFPRTSLPSVQDYLDVFTEYVQQGRDVLCICITTKFSGSYNSAMTAASALLEEYPERKIRVIDARVNTVLQGQLVLEAARMRDNGLSLEEAAAETERIRDTGRIFFTIGSMDYLVHGGRVGKVLGAAASTLRIRPIIVLKEGEIFPAGVSRSRRSSLKKVLEQLAGHFRKNACAEEYSIAVGYGYDYEEALEFQKSVKDTLQEFGFSREIPVCQIGATIAVHTGPYPLGIGMIRRYDA